MFLKASVKFIRGKLICTEKEASGLNSGNFLQHDENAEQRGTVLPFPAVRLKEHIN